MHLIRTIQPGDNAPLAFIVRAALTEFGAAKPGTVYFDPTTDHLYELFQAPGAAYFVAEAGGIAEEAKGLAEANEIAETKRAAEADGLILGGAGLFPSPGLPPGTCELVKMYLRPEARGLGLGGELIRRCITHAREAGYRSIYLETLPELGKAVTVYERFGFRYLDGPLGDTGHFGCDIWMLLEL